MEFVRKRICYFNFTLNNFKSPLNNSLQPTLHNTQLNYVQNEQIIPSTFEIYKPAFQPDIQQSFKLTSVLIQSTHKILFIVSIQLNLWIYNQDPFNKWTCIQSSKKKNYKNPYIHRKWKLYGNKPLLNIVKFSRIKIHFWSNWHRILNFTFLS